MPIEHLRDSLKRFNNLYIGSSILMVVVGILAIVLPLAAGIGVSIFVSWLIFLTGLAHLVYAFAARGAGGFLWRLLLPGAIDLFVLFSPIRLGQNRSRIRRLSRLDSGPSHLGGAEQNISPATVQRTVQHVCQHAQPKRV